MRRAKTRWIAPAVVVIVGAALLAQTAISQGDKIKWVTEAETYAAINPSTTVITDNNASGNKAVTYPLKRPHAQEENPNLQGDGGYTIYKVNLPKQAEYRIWVLANWYDGCGNSYFLNVDNEGTQVVGQDGTYKRYHWVKANDTYNLGAGEHKIKLQNREDGARADQIVITDNLRWTPVRAMTPTGDWVQ